MASFALITEGITDQAVLENILIGLYGDDVEVNPLQPLRDATDTSRTNSDSFGGWEQVIQYCQLEDFSTLFMFNDYVIIQIDTDMGEHPNFGVALTRDGIDRPHEDLVDDVRQKIISKISPIIYEQYERFILFAIAVHSLECWLLPLYAQQNAHIVKIKNCGKQLERDAKRLNLNSAKDYQSYDRLSDPYQTTEQLEKAKQHQPSLALFLDSLPPP